MQARSVLPQCQLAKRKSGKNIARERSPSRNTMKKKKGYNVKLSLCKTLWHGQNGGLYRGVCTRERIGKKERVAELWNMRFCREYRILVGQNMVDLSMEIWWTSSLSKVYDDCIHYSVCLRECYPYGVGNQYQYYITSVILSESSLVANINTEITIVI